MIDLKEGAFVWISIESPIQECHDLAASADLIGTEVAGIGHIACHNFPVFVKGNIDKVKT